MAALVEEKNPNKSSGSWWSKFRRKFSSEKTEKDCNQYYSIPVFLRHDGVTIKAGCLVNRGTKLYIVREVLVQDQGGEGSAQVVVSPVSGHCSDAVVNVGCEVTLLPLSEVQLAQPRRVSLHLAQQCMHKVALMLPSSPPGIRRVMRRHQLASLIRREVQSTLVGFSRENIVSLGLIDWAHDPGILGLELSTQYSLQHRMDDYLDCFSPLDVLLGRGWDVLPVSGCSGFRVVTQLRLEVDINHQFNLRVHAANASGDLHPLTYRSDCLLTSNDSVLERCDGDSPDSSLECGPLAVSMVTHPPTSTDISQPVSLLWEEFQDSELQGHENASDHLKKSRENVDDNMTPDELDCSNEDLKVPLKIDNDLLYSLTNANNNVPEYEELKSVNTQSSDLKSMNLSYNIVIPKPENNSSFDLSSSSKSSELSQRLTPLGLLSGIFDSNKTIYTYPQDWQHLSSSNSQEVEEDFD